MQENEEISNILSQLTVSQKASLTVGADFWNTTGLPEQHISSIRLSDGPHGLRKQDGAVDNLGLNMSEPAICFPSESAVACSFDPSLVEAMGQAIGEEARAQNVDIVLGPGVNMKRSPLCGRNFEYFSEDPFLSGTLAAAYIRGVQSRGVGTSLKHFVANNQEKARLVSDSLVDERALNEIYLRAFMIAVEQGNPWTVMTAYNKLNGTHCSENPFLLTEKLRREWGYRGAVITDWGALVNSIPTVEAGCDLVMPGKRKDHENFLVAGVKEGTLDSNDLDRAAGNVIALAKKCDEAQDIPFVCDYGKHVNLARRIARESAVLLENDGILPLDRTQHIAVIGAFATEPRYQGSGSSKINPRELDCAYDALAQRCPNLAYARGYDPASGTTTEQMLHEAETVAAQNDVAIVFAGLPNSFESEGIDRTSLLMPQGHVRLIKRVRAANSRTVVVLSGGAPFELPWMADVGRRYNSEKAAKLGSRKPAAVLLMYLAGCQSGHACTDLLLGDESPSGKLAETWPLTLVDTPLSMNFPIRSKTIPYIESVYTGYRYYDSVGIPVAYPFGYGLSYTQFAYENGSVTRTERGFDVSFDIVNCGSRDGSEIAQVYVHAKNPAVYQPDQALAGFTKVRVRAGEKARAHVFLDGDAFSYWDEDAHTWRIDEGVYDIRISASSRDCRIVTSIELVAGEGPFPICTKKVVSHAKIKRQLSYYLPRPHGFSRHGFEAVYGRELPTATPAFPYTLDSSVSDLDTTFIGRRLHHIVRRITNQLANDDEAGVMKALIQDLDDMPLRSILMSDVPRSTVDGIIDFLNREYLKVGREFIRWAVEGERRTSTQFPPHNLR